MTAVTQCNSYHHITVPFFHTWSTAKFFHPHDQFSSIGLAFGHLVLRLNLKVTKCFLLPAHTPDVPTKTSTKNIEHSYTHQRSNSLVLFYTPHFPHPVYSLALASSAQAPAPMHNMLLSAMPCHVTFLMAFGITRYTVPHTF